MANMFEKSFKNEELGLELTSYIDKQQNAWFKGKDVAKILEYKDTDDAVRRHISQNHKRKLIFGQPGKAPGCSMTYFIDEAGFYELVFSSKLEAAKKFRDWVFTNVLPSIRKFGYYKLFDNPNNKMFKIENEMDLHSKVVHLIRNFYPDAIMVPGLGENQDTSEKRINSWKMGYMRGQPDLTILNYHKDYNGLCIEFKSPTNYYEVSDSQKEMKERYQRNCYKFILSNDYD